LPLCPPPCPPLFPYTTLFRSLLRRLAPTSSVDQPDRPEIIREIRLHEVLVRHGEVALQTPMRPPGVTDNEPLILVVVADGGDRVDRKSTRLNSSHVAISYAVF